MNDGVQREVYLAGGCFWGTEAFCKKLPGVTACQVGYANGHADVEHPSYEQVCSGATGCAETVRVTYDPAIISLSLLLQAYVTTIDPVSVNRQGGDVGEQYRTGIYWTDAADEPVVRSVLHGLQRELTRLGRGTVAVEACPLQSFWPAEDYHQDYLDKNPGGYCHVDLGGAARFVRMHERDFAVVAHAYTRLDDPRQIRAGLDEMGYRVTQEAGTERPFSSPLDQCFDEGIYVDRISGEPLFSSANKFDSGCGWPAFTHPITATATVEREDTSLPYMPRTEVRSAVSGAHLGHVFEDGPRAQGGQRYCINGAALEFIPRDQMEARGYGYLL